MCQSEMTALQISLMNLTDFILHKKFSWFVHYVYCKFLQDDMTDYKTVKKLDSLKNIV